MSEPRTPAGGAPPPEAVQEHVKQTGEEKNLGAGNEEPDPVTSENPPNQIRGETKRGNRTEKDRRQAITDRSSN
jgi:hypothetical protein